MRRQLLEALTYPRLVVLDSINRKVCQHDSLFDSSCDHCHSCDLQQECHWLSCLNDFSDFANRPTYTMNASLLYSIKLISSRNMETQGHDEACTCESCTWTRDAQQLTQEFQTQYSAWH